jgi:hypothetical protein
MAPDTRHHSEKWHRCWEHVQAKGHDEHSAAAICTAVLGEDSYEAAAALDDPAPLLEAMEHAVRAALAPVVGRVKALETTVATVGPVKDLIASLEALGPVAGPTGPPGPPGPPGADGLGFDDATVEYDGERTIVLKWARGDARAERAIKLPAMLYRGVFAQGKLYERGDVVTWAGSLWHCNADTTTRPGDGAPTWTLAVKRGRDGAR